MFAVLLTMIMAFSLISTIPVSAAGGIDSGLQSRLRYPSANKDEVILSLQSFLGNRGNPRYYTDKLDGIWGKNTKGAVEKFQDKTSCLSKDGIVGPKTTIAIVQTILKECYNANKTKYLDPGAIDGIWGPNTEKAVARYKKNNGLAENGIVDVLTWGYLCNL